MEKYIGFDIDSKKVIACAVQKGQKEMYSTIAADVLSMRKYLKRQKADGSRAEDGGRTTDDGGTRSG
jgi:hypothetical protein